VRYDYTSLKKPVNNRQDACSTRIMGDVYLIFPVAEYRYEFKISELL
jgi:hypothetical protein